MARTLTVVRTEPTRTAVKRAAETLSETTQEMLDCRDLRHPWEVVGQPFYVGAEIRRKLVCLRCGTEATDRWTPKGKRVARAYKYAKGYQAKGVRIRPTDVRREVLKRVEVFDSEDAMMSWMVSGGRRARRTG